jgi:hypothetical protein
LRNGIDNGRSRTMSHVALYDANTNEQLVTFIDDDDYRLPFIKVFKWVSDDGRIKHLIQREDMARLLLYHKLPATLVMSNANDDAYFMNDTPLNNNLFNRFIGFAAFIYSLRNDGRAIIIKSIGIVPFTCSIN